MFYQSQHRFASGGRLCVVAVLWRFLLVVALLLLSGNVVIVSVLLTRSILFGKAMERLWSWPCPFRVCAAPRCNLMTGNGHPLVDWRWHPLFPRTKLDIKSAPQQSSEMSQSQIWKTRRDRVPNKNNKIEIIADVNTWISAGLDGMDGRRDPNHKGKTSWQMRTHNREKEKVTDRCKAQQRERPMNPHTRFEILKEKLERRRRSGYLRHSDQSEFVKERSVWIPICQRLGAWLSGPNKSGWE